MVFSIDLALMIENTLQAYSSYTVSCQVLIYFFVSTDFFRGNRKIVERVAFID